LTHLQEDRQLLRADVLAALYSLIAQHTAQGWNKRFVVPEDCIEDLLQVFDFIRVQDVQGTSLVACSTDSAWFTTELIALEEFVVGTASLASVVAALSDYGQHKGATRLLLGTRAVRKAQHAALARLYESTGCTVSCIELTKELPDGQKD
jgi:hypothetical protein